MATCSPARPPRRRGDPARQGGLEGGDVEAAEEVGEGGLAGGLAAAEAQGVGQGGALVAAELGDGGVALGAGEHGEDGQRQDGGQRVADAPGVARVGDRGEHLEQGKRGGHGKILLPERRPPSFTLRASSLQYQSPGSPGRTPGHHSLALDSPGRARYTPAMSASPRLSGRPRHLPRAARPAALPRQARRGGRPRHPHRPRRRAVPGLPRRARADRRRAGRRLPGHGRHADGDQEQDAPAAARRRRPSRRKTRAANWSASCWSTSEFKEAAAALEELADRQGLPPAAAARAPPPAAKPARRRCEPVELWDLVSAFGRLMRETLASQPQTDRRRSHAAARPHRLRARPPGGRGAAAVLARCSCRRTRGRGWSGCSWPSWS